MLVLSRKINESIVINSDIEIKITEIKGDVVRLGIKAPKEVSIYRKEVLDTIDQSNKAAVLSPKQQAPVLPESAKKWLKQNIR